MSSGGRTTPSIDSRAARSIASPPLACTLSIHTPRRAAERQAPATVLGMSWNFRSRNTSKPRSWRRAMTAGPSATKSSLPTLTRQSLGAGRAANARAGSAAPKSGGPMMRLLSNRLPREVPPRALEPRGAAGQECFPPAARRALPEELARLEAAIGAQVDGERLGMRVNQVLHQLQVLPALGRDAQQLRVDEAVETHERRIAPHLVAHQPPRRLVTLVLRGRLVDHAQQVEPRIAMLQSAQERQTLVGAPERLVAFDHPVGGKPEVRGILRFDRLPRLDRLFVPPRPREPFAAQQVGAHAFAVDLERAREVGLCLLGRPIHVRGDRELAVIVGDLLLVVALGAHLELLG